MAQSKPSSGSRELLFVCSGNTCRSPMAERLMAALLGPDKTWTVRSAGLGAREGSPASEGAERALRERGLGLEGHRAHRLAEADVRRADCIVTMTRDHRDAIVAAYPEAAAKTRTLHAFGASRPEDDVLDPFGGELDTYRLTRDEISGALPDLILSLYRPSTP